MKITKAEFITSQVKFQTISDLPEIAFVGRSNVGKSSLINMLANNGKLARTSNTPGRTRLINLFNINDSFMLVDLPGYGFQKGSKKEKAAWASMIEDYLENSNNLKCVLLLVDVRHEPAESDKVMLHYLYAKQIPFFVVATKADKLSRAELQRAIITVSQGLAIGKDNIVVTSSEKRTGKDELLLRIEAVLNT